MMRKPKTSYQALLECVADAAEKHPSSFVIVDAKSHRLLGSGTDPDKLFARVQKKLKPGQVPVVYSKPRKGEVLIF